MADKMLYLHAGMDKAGSTSIQVSMARYDDGVTRYCHLNNGPTHAAALLTVFSDDPYAVFHHRVCQRTEADVDALKEAWTHEIDRELALDHINLVISSETLSHGDKFNETELRRLHEHAASHGRRVGMIVYVRDPVGYLGSSLGQLVNVGLASCAGDRGELRLPHLGYRQRFEKHLAVFGRDAIAFVRFDRAGFPGGCLVADFAGRVGADIGRVTVKQENDGLPLAALALLYFWNRPDSWRAGSESGLRARRKLVALLRDAFSAGPFGGGKFRFADEFLKPRVDWTDVAWMESVAGFSLEPSPQRDDGRALSISCVDDLRDVRDQSLTALRQLLDERRVRYNKADSANALLDRLYDRVRFEVGVQGLVPRRMQSLLRRFRAVIG